MNNSGMPRLKRSKFLLVFGSIWLIVGIPFLLVGRFMILDEQRFQAESVPVVGTVLGKRYKDDRDKDGHTSRSYYLSYRFDLDQSREVQGEDSVDSEIWERLSAGDTIDLSYIPSEPSKNRVARPASFVAGYAFLGFGALAMLIGAISIYVDVKKRLTAKRLLSSGLIAEGKITGVGPGNVTINNVTQWRIHYTFNDRMGVEVKGTSEHMSPDQADQFRVNDKGHVRYDPNNSASNLWVG